MNQGQWVRFMDFMMNAHANMEDLLFGRCLWSYLTTFLWLLWLRENSFAFMVGYLLVLIVWTILDHWKGYRKYHNKGQCVICYGRIQILSMVGGWIKEEWATPSERILLSSSTTQMAWRWFAERTSWWWAYLFPHSGLLNHPQKQCHHDLLRPELLLPMWKPCSHYGSRLTAKTKFHHLRPSPKQNRCSSKEACPWLFPLIYSINNIYFPCF